MNCFCSKSLTCGVVGPLLGTPAGILKVTSFSRDAVDRALLVDCSQQGQHLTIPLSPSLQPNAGYESQWPSLSRHEVRQFNYLCAGNRWQIRNILVVSLFHKDKVNPVTNLCNVPANSTCTSHQGFWFSNVCTSRQNHGQGYLSTGFGASLGVHLAR